MIQDISPYHIDNRFTDVRPNTESFLVFIQERTILLKMTEQALTLPQFGQISSYELKTTFLFSVSEHHFFLAGEWNQAETSDWPAAVSLLLENGYQFYDISIFRECSPKWLCFAGATAYQLGRWYDNNRYCGRCGNVLRNGLHERVLYCENCKNTIYPKIQPVVIVGVINQDHILFTKYADIKHSENYALIAGFAEIGESIEETVQREVMEEAGIKVKNIRYYKSQPWPFSDSLLLGFFCELDGSDHITVDNHELAVAEWVHRDKMGIQDDGISLTYEMMMHFKENAIPQGGNTYE